MSGIASESPAVQQCKARPHGRGIGPTPQLDDLVRLVVLRHVLVQSPSCTGIAATLRKLLDTPDADPAIESGGHHIADLDPVAGSNHPTAIDAHTAATHKSRSVASRFDDPRMPQPLVDPLPVHDAALAAVGSGGAHRLALLFGAALQLFLERSELGKR